MNNWIICPVRNGLPLTRVAMKDFLAQDIGDVSVLLLDNGSTDGTTQWATTLPSNVHVSQLAGRGVAHSWNFGLRWVFGQGAEYALVVNNDVRLRPDTYRHLVEDGGGFVTAVGTTDMEKIKPAGQCIPAADIAGFKPTREAMGPDGTIYSEVDGFGYTKPNPAAKRPHPDFSCFVIRREVFDSVGPFNEQYAGAYAEDAEYHLRMHNAGVKACCLDLPFWHLGAGTLKYADEDEVVAIQSAADANRKRFHKSHGVEVGSKEYYALFGHGAPAQDGGAL